MLHDVLTRLLATHMTQSAWRDLPHEVSRQVSRTFVNFLGCCVGGSQHEVVTKTASALNFRQPVERSGVTQLPVCPNTMLTALLYGLSSSVYAFDDTHAEAIVHASSPVGSAILALTREVSVPITGQNFLLAFGWGIEITCRLSKAISVAPARGDLGWQQSGLSGAVGAAAACSMLLGLDSTRSASAMGTAACLAAGLRVAHGTMTMHLLPAHAASIGVEAALLAQVDFSGPPNALEGRYGYLRLFAEIANPGALRDELGTRWELLSNTFKAYPCGTVIHPVIDACLALRAEYSPNVSAVSEVEIWVNETGAALADRVHPTSMTEAQVSLQYWAAAALLHGSAGIDQLAPAAIADAKMVALRAKCRVIPSGHLASDAASVTVTLDSGRKMSRSVEHGLGSVSRPLSNGELSLKFLAQCVPILGEEEGRKLLRKCWSLEEHVDMRAFC
jgi:2-methylcitrate dehydratase PrpD